MADEDAPEVYGFASMPYRLITDHGLSDYGLRLLGAIMMSCHDKRTCFPSNETLGKTTGGKTNRTVIRGLIELESAGLIRRLMNPTTKQRDGIELLWERLQSRDNFVMPSRDKIVTPRDMNVTAFDEGVTDLSRLEADRTIGTCAGTHGRLRVEREEKKEEPPPTPPRGSAGVVVMNAEGEPEELGEVFRPTEAELARLREIADSLFGEESDFASHACLAARMFPALWVAAAMKAAAGSAKRVAWPYVVGILRRYQVNDPPGPEKPVPSGRGKQVVTPTPGPTEILTARRRPGINGEHEGRQR